MAARAWRMDFSAPSCTMSYQWLVARSQRFGTQLTWGAAYHWFLRSGRLSDLAEKGWVPVTAESQPAGWHFFNA